MSVKVIIYEVRGDQTYYMKELRTLLETWKGMIPPEYIDSARLNIDSPRFDDEEVAIQVYYFRPETPDEIQAKELRAIRAKSKSEEQEKAMLARLKAKYEQ